MDAPSRLLRTFAASLSFLVPVVAMSLLLVGCGGTSEETPPADTTPETEETTAIAVPSPGEVVGQFLDRVRRGGNDSGANQLLTKLAQQEMVRIGRPLQFPGSPDTTFQLGRMLPIPDQPDSVYVETFLTEPAPEAAVSYEVVWTLKKQNTEWRISGFVLNQGDQLDPLEIDFENGDQMEALLASMEGEDSTQLR